MLVLGKLKDPVDERIIVEQRLDLAGGARFGPDVEWVTTIDYAVDANRRDAFAAAIRRYYPALDAARLQPGYAGIRPKLAGPGEPAADGWVKRWPDLPGVPSMDGDDGTRRAKKLS